MSEQQLLALLGNGGAWVVVVVLLWRIGNGIVESVRELRAEVALLRAEVASHTRTDVEAMAELRADLVDVKATFATALDLTPVETRLPRPGRERERRTPPKGVSVSERPPRRGTHHDE